MVNSRLEESSLDLQKDKKFDLGPPIVVWDIRAIYGGLNLQGGDMALGSKLSSEIPADGSNFFDSRMILDALKKDGWTQRSDNRLRGKSGAFHSFSLIAEAPPNTSNPNERREFMAIDIVSSPVQVDSPAVLTLFAKTLDCELRLRCVVAIPGLGEQAKILARNYNIYFVEFGDPTEKNSSVTDAGEDFQEMLRLVSKDRIKRGAIQRPRNSVSTKRNSMDIMADILAVTTAPSSKSEIMACANLSYEQCQKYIPVLENLGLLSKSIEDGIHVKYSITEKGREYKSGVSGQFGRINEDEGSIWTSRRQANVARVQ